jgi:hypothetical protein
VVGFQILKWRKVPGGRWFNAHPHPGPLPRGEGETVAAFGRNLASWFKGSKARIFRMKSLPGMRFIF